MVAARKHILRGFTLVELLVVIAIIGILTTIGVGSFQTSRIKARDSNRKHDLQQVANSLEAYFNDHQQYPLSNSSNQIVCKSGDTPCPWGNTLEDDNNTEYMVKLPQEPKSSYEYVYESDGSYFKLYAHLENDLDPQAYNDSDPEYASFPNCGLEKCNFIVKSSNAQL